MEHLPTSPSEDFLEFAQLNPFFIYRFTKFFGPSTNHLHRVFEPDAFKHPTHAHTAFEYVNLFLQENISYDELQAPDNPSNALTHLIACVNNAPDTTNVPSFKVGDIPGPKTCPQAEELFFSAIYSIRNNDFATEHYGKNPITVFVDDEGVPLFVKKYIVEHSAIALRSFRASNTLQPAGTILNIHTNSQADRATKAPSLAIPDFELRTLSSDGKKATIKEMRTPFEQDIRVVRASDIAVISPGRLSMWAHPNTDERLTFAALPAFITDREADKYFFETSDERKMLAAYSMNDLRSIIKSIV